MSSEAKHDIHDTRDVKNKKDKKYNDALTKALTAFYKKLKITQPGFYDHTRFDPYVEKIAKKRGAGTGAMDNIQALYDGLKKKYTQDYPSTIADALKSIAKFACTYANECDVAGWKRSDDSVNMEDQYSNVSQKQSSRREMKGPSDISDILAGVKTKKVNIKNSDTSSTISVSDLQDMKGNLPKKSKRKPRSARNTVSLNL